MLAGASPIIFINAVIKSIIDTTTSVPASNLAASINKNIANTPNAADANVEDTCFTISTNSFKSSLKSLGNIVTPANNVPAISAISANSGILETSIETSILSPIPSTSSYV